MKAYQLRSPEQLREVLPLVKNEQDRKRAANVAAVWSVATRQNRAYVFDVYIRLGRSAMLCRAHQGREIVLGDMKLKVARAFSSKLNERRCTANEDHSAVVPG